MKITDLRSEHNFLRSCGWLILAVILAPAIVVFAEGNETKQQQIQMEAADPYVSPTNGLGAVAVGKFVVIVSFSAVEHGQCRT